MSPRKDEKSPLSAKALFRFHVVSQVVALRLQGLERSAAVLRVAAMVHPTPTSDLKRVSERSIGRWLAKYEAAGAEGLEDQPRTRTTSSVVLPEDLLAYLVEQHGDDRDASIPELIRRAEEVGLARSGSVDRTTVYRAFQRMGLSMVRRKKRRGRDMRRFAYAHRMQMVLCDGKHFRAGAKRLKRMAFFFLDDATRCGLDVVVGTSETARLFLEGLYATVRRFGKMDILYIDGGPGFIALDVLEVCRSLEETHVVHGEARYPEGHGKIERFNQTALNAVLRNLDGRADVDPDCGALALRLRHWLHEIYNHIPHESLGRAESAKQTPWERFSEDARELRLPKSDDALRRAFVVHLQRTVSHDKCISINAVAYEVPGSVRERKVVVQHRLLEDTYHLLHEGRVIRLHPVDLAANAQSPRARRTERPQGPPVPRPSKSAADMAFERDLGPVTGPDGGFVDPLDPQTKDAP